MARGKGLDDLFLAGGSPRLRRWYPVPEAARQHRRPYELPERGPVQGGGTLKTARSLTANAIEAFVSEIPSTTGRARLVRSAPGTGKSTALAASIHRHRVEARIVVGTKRLAQEQAERHGYNLIVGRSPSNCQRYDVVRALGEAGHPVEALACGTPFERRCPFYDGCPYLAQFARTGPRVGTAEQLFNRMFWRGGTLAVVDDGDLQRSLIERMTLRGAVLERAVEQLAEGYDGERAVLQVVRHALIDAPRRWLLAGGAWDHLARVAAQHGGDIAELLDRLPARETLPSPFDDVDGYVSLRTVEAVPPASVATLLAALREELPAFGTGEDFNSRLRISAGKIEVGRLREHIADREGVIVRRMPLLVLDATPLTVLIDHLTALHERLEDLSAEVALPPNVRVVQYATGTRGHTSLRSDIQHQRVIDEIQRERLRQPCGPDDEALVVYKEAAQRLAAAGFAADRVLTFGSARGTNVLASARRLHVVGRPFPPTDETFYLAQIIHHDEAGVTPEIVVRRRTFGGQRYAVDVVDYADPRMEALLDAARDAELLQVVHRARLMTLEPQRHLDGDRRETVTLVLHTSHPVAGLRVDELILDGESTRDRNTDRRREAERRIEQAITRIRSSGTELTADAVAKEAGASWRTVRKYLGNEPHTPVVRATGEMEEQPVGNSLHTPVDEATDDATSRPGRTGGDEGLGNELHTPFKDLLSRVQNVPQACGGVAARGSACPGGCGTLMPPGQKCFECAAAATLAWKAAQRKKVGP